MAVNVRDEGRETAPSDINQNAPLAPTFNWTAVGAPDEVTQVARAAGYSQPTAIQNAIIPLALQQRDVVIIGDTGPGKIAAYVVPLLPLIAQSAPPDGDRVVLQPYAVVMAASSEVAGVAEEVTRIANLGGLQVFVIGEDGVVPEHYRKVQRTCRIVIASPAGLVESVKKEHVVLDACRYVVLHDASGMLDSDSASELAGALDRTPSIDQILGLRGQVIDASNLTRTTLVFNSRISPSLKEFVFKYLYVPSVILTDDFGGAQVQTPTPSLQSALDFRLDWPPALPPSAGVRVVGSAAGSLVLPSASAPLPRPYVILPDGSCVRAEEGKKLWTYKSASNPKMFRVNGFLGDLNELADDDIPSVMPSTAVFEPEGRYRLFCIGTARRPAKAVSKWTWTFPGGLGRKKSVLQKED